MYCIPRSISKNSLKFPSCISCIDCWINKDLSLPYPEDVGTLPNLVKFVRWLLFSVVCCSCCDWLFLRLHRVSARWPDSSRVVVVFPSPGPAAHNNPCSLLSIDQRTRVICKRFQQRMLKMRTTFFPQFPWGFGHSTKKTSFPPTYRWGRSSVISVQN